LKNPYNRFDEFTSVQNRRFDVLKSILDELKLHYSVVQLGEKRHFIISPRTQSPPASPRKEHGGNVFVAHYDALEGSEGANDNASGVFALLCAALILCENGECWTVIFTDKEELNAGESLRTQGSYLLAYVLRDTHLANADFFVFDACGRGETIVISTLADYLIKKDSTTNAAWLKQKFRGLRNRVMGAANKSGANKIMLMPTPFSDDAGFLRAGLAAQTITTLPDGEAALFAQLSRAKPLYIEGLINRSFSGSLDPKFIPKTWRQINSPRDTKDKLDFQATKVIVKLVHELSKNSG